MSVLRTIWSFVWLIASNAVYVLVVLYVFGRLQGRLETLIVGLFGILYVTIRGASVAQWMDQTTRGWGLLKQFEELKELVVPEYQPDRKEWDSAERSLTLIYFKVFIAGLFSTAILIICLWQIFSVL